MTRRGSGPAGEDHSRQSQHIPGLISARPSRLPLGPANAHTTAEQPLAIEPGRPLGKNRRYLNRHLEPDQREQARYAWAERNGKTIRRLLWALILGWPIIGWLAKQVLGLLGFG